jgi:hypothetical protein
MTNIVFCLPGNSFSNTFLVKWSETLQLLNSKNYNVKISNATDSNVFFVRNKCLRGNVLSGNKQKVFQDNIEYDYIFWIDSDIVFTPEQVLYMIQKMENNKELNILSGLYLMKGGQEYATVDKGNFTYNKFIANGGSFSFIKKEEILLKEGNDFEVDYTGFGFICIRKGVFDKLEYPWFKPIFINLDVELIKNNDAYDNDASGNIDMNIKEIYETIHISDTCSEDVGFCRMIIEKGEKIICDPKIIVGHEKSIVEYFNANYLLNNIQNSENYQEQMDKLKKYYNNEETTDYNNEETTDYNNEETTDYNNEETTDYNNEETTD